MGRALDGGDAERETQEAEKAEARELDEELKLDQFCKQHYRLKIHYDMRCKSLEMQGGKSDKRTGLNTHGIA